MLKKLHIKHFKCFFDQEIEFGSISVLAGANGVGKSSIIQGLLLLRRAFQLKTSIATQQIAINDKINTFLELGNSRELLNTRAENSEIVFNLWDEFNNQESISFSVDNHNPLSLHSGKWEKEYMPPEIPFHFKPINYLNAERLGPRNTQDLSSQSFLNVGFQGEFTGQAIYEASLKIDKVSEARQITENNTSPSFERQIEAWMNFLIPDIEINIQAFENIRQVRIGIRKKGSGTEFLHPNNIGFGISYVLPIVVSGLIAEVGSLLIVENPEAHLHPFGQSRVGQFLAQMAGAGIQIVVETHSEHIINGIRIASLKEKVNYQDVIVNFFSQEKGQEVKINKIQLNETADLGKWPSGFFDQAQRDFAEIMKYKKNKK